MMYEEKSIEWAKLSDRDKVGYIIVHVFGFYILPDTVYIKGHFELPREKDALPGLHWPVAFWNGDGNCWQIVDIEPVFFDPLKDMNDLWSVVRYVHQYVDKTLFLINLEMVIGEDWDDIIANMSSERVLIAVLKTCGVEVKE